jgi:hypothetical protein
MLRGQRLARALRAEMELRNAPSARAESVDARTPSARRCRSIVGLARGQSAGVLDLQVSRSEAALICWQGEYVVLEKASESLNQRLRRRHDAPHQLIKTSQKLDL